MKASESIARIIGDDDDPSLCNPFMPNGRRPVTIRAVDLRSHSLLGVDVLLCPGRHAAALLEAIEDDQGADGIMVVAIERWSHQHLMSLRDVLLLLRARLVYHPDLDWADNSTRPKLWAGDSLSTSRAYVSLWQSMGVMLTTRLSDLEAFSLFIQAADMARSALQAVHEQLQQAVSYRCTSLGSLDSIHALCDYAAWHPANPPSGAGWGELMLLAEESRSLDIQSPQG